MSRKAVFIDELVGFRLAGKHVEALWTKAATY